MAEGLLANRAYWQKLSEEISKEVEELKSENKKLKELLEFYALRNGYCYSCSRYTIDGHGKDCEIKKALQ